jgi:hypothetical protein
VCVKGTGQVDESQPSLPVLVARTPSPLGFVQECDSIRVSSSLFETVRRNAFRLAFVFAPRGSLYEYQKKGVAEKGVWKLLKTRAGYQGGSEERSSLSLRFLRGTPSVVFARVRIVLILKALWGILARTSVQRVRKMQKRRRLDVGNQRQE